ncbi:hypothetical protein FXO37_22128 [Capsicum annuum]|nr:hypothetical protein FXO37_22128 [Capsicum annuum]
MAMVAGGQPPVTETEIQDLRRLIPKQCELKGEINIGLLSNRHVLIRATKIEYYVHRLSKLQFYITMNYWSYPMKTLKWDLMFHPNEKTTTAMVWISFPSLPPNFFAREAVLSLAIAIGKPLQVDLATQNKTRSSCARVKVEIDLLGEFLKRINIGMRKKTGKVVEKWIHIKYDYMPKYCKKCKLQGHNENECYVIHLDLYPKDDREEGEKQDKMKPQKEKDADDGKEISEDQNDKKNDKRSNSQETGDSFSYQAEEINDLDSKAHDVEVADNNLQIIAKFEPEVLKIQRLTQKEKQQKKDREEDVDMHANIDQIRRDGDLSPRQIGQLKEKNRKDHEKTELEDYRRRLGLPNAKVNYSDKIWLFWKDWEEIGAIDSSQHLTMEYKLRGASISLKVTAVKISRVGPLAQRDVIASCHWKLTIGKLHDGAIRSYHVTTLPITWKFGEMCQYRRATLEFDNYHLSNLRNALKAQGALYYVEGETFQDEEIEVKFFITNEEWDKQKLISILSEEMVELILQTVKPTVEGHYNDKPWSMGNTYGQFSVKSAWDVVRKKKENRRYFDYSWNKGLPFKYNFFLWRVWLIRIPTDDNLRRMRIQLVSRCWCCVHNSIHYTMSQNGSHTGSIDGYHEDKDHLGDAGRASAIRIPPMKGNGLFHITSVMIYLLQMKRLSYGIASTLLDQVANKSRGCHTRDIDVALGDPSASFVSHKQKKKEEKIDTNMAKVMTQLDLLTKHVMGYPPKAVNIIAFNGSKSYDDEEIESLDEEI